MNDENVDDLSELMNGIRQRLNLNDIELVTHREVSWNVLYNRYLNGEDSKCFPNNEANAEMSPDDNIAENEQSGSGHENDVDSSISDFESADELDDDQSDLITQLLNKTYTMAKNIPHNDDSESISLSSFSSNSNPLIDEVTLQEGSLTLQELLDNNHKEKMKSLLNCNKEKDEVLSENVDSDNIRCSRFSDEMLEYASIPLNTVLTGTTIVDKNELVYNWIKAQTFAGNASQECEIVYKNENFDLNSSSESETRMLHENYYKVTPKKNKSRRKLKPREILRNDKINMNKKPIILNHHDVDNSSSSVDTTAYIISSRKNNKKTFNARLSTYKSNNKHSLKVNGKDKELTKVENCHKSIEKKLQTKVQIDSVSLNISEEILKAHDQPKNVVGIDSTTLNKNKKNLIHHNTLGNTKTDCDFTRYTAERSFIDDIFTLDISPSDGAYNMDGIESNNIKKTLLSPNSPNTTKNHTNSQTPTYKIVSDIFADDSDSDDTNKKLNSEVLDKPGKSKANSPEVNIHDSMNSAKAPLNRQPKRRSKKLIKPLTSENVNIKFTNNKSNRKSAEKNLQIKNSETLKNLSKVNTTLEERVNETGFTTKSFIEDMFYQHTTSAGDTNIESSFFNFNRSKYNKNISDIFADDTDSAESYEIKESYNDKLLDETENTINNTKTNIMKMHSIFSDSDTDDYSEVNKVDNKTFPDKNLTNFTKNGMKFNTSDTGKHSELNMLNNKNILDQTSNEETEPSGITFLRKTTRSKHNFKEKSARNKKDINKNSIENSKITNISIITPTKRIRKSSNRPLKRKCRLLS